MRYLVKVHKKKKLQIPRKSLQVIKDYESEKKKYIKNGTCKGKSQSTIKTSRYL